MLTTDNVFTSSNVSAGDYLQVTLHTALRAETLSGLCASDAANKCKCLTRRLLCKHTENTCRKHMLAFSITYVCRGRTHSVKHDYRSKWKQNHLVKASEKSPTNISLKRWGGHACWGVSSLRPSILWLCWNICSHSCYVVMGQGRKALCAIVLFHLISVTGSCFITWAIAKLTSNLGWLWTHYLVQALNLGWSFWLRLLRHGILSLLISSDITWIYRFWTIFSWYSILSRLFPLSLNFQNKEQRNRQMFRASKGSRDSPNGT